MNKVRINGQNFSGRLFPKIKQFINPEVFIVSLSLIGIIVVYWHDLTILLDDALRNEMSSYILALPFLIAYMIYQKRKLLKAQLSLEMEKHENVVFKDIGGISLCLSAFFVYAYGSFTSAVLEYHLVSLIIFIFGCSIFLLGVQNLKNLVFPLGCLLLLIVPYREEAYQASAQLSVLTSIITFNLLKLLGFPVTLSSLYESPSIMVQTSSGQQVPFVIDIPCAGAYSLIGFFVFALFFAYVSKGSKLKKAVWLLLGFALIYTVNITRITLILTVGYWFGADAAMGLFHLLSGSVLIFSASFLMLLIGEKFLMVRVFRGHTVAEENCPSCKKDKTSNETFCNFCGKFLNISKITISKTDLGKFLALSLLIAALVNLQIPTFALAQQNLMEMEIQNLTGSKEAQSFLPEVEGYEPKFIYRDERFESIAQQDASLLYVYYPQNSSHAPIFASVEIADSYSKVHNWEICLYVVRVEQGRQIVNPIVTKDIQILGNPPLTGRLFVFQYIASGQTVMILYWYERVAFKIGDGWGSKYIKTSIIAYLDSFVRSGEIRSVDEYANLQKKMTSIAQNIINHWEPVKAWSDFAVAFAHWGQTLAITTVVAASSFAAIFHLLEKRAITKRAYSVYKQLMWHSTFSKEEKEILKILELLAQKERASGEELASLYMERTGKKIGQKRLTGIMKYAEDHGLTEKEITNKDGTPAISWKTSQSFKI